MPAPVIIIKITTSCSFSGGSLAVAEMLKSAVTNLLPTARGREP